MSIRKKSCLLCKHYNGCMSCDAYPGGIPCPILSGDEKHDEPYPNDSGIQFEPIEDGSFLSFINKETNNAC